MKRLIYKTFAVVLAMIIQVSTGGVLVYIHHCQHQQETYTSLFVGFGEGEEHPCHHEAPSIPLSCCGHEAQEPTGACDASCCHDLAMLLKFIPDTEPVQPGSTKAFPVALDIPNDLLISASFWNEDETETFYDIPPEKPPISGRELVILYQQIKIDLMA
jgi:hypothetical protein